MSEALAESQHRDGATRQFLSQSQAETTRLAKQLTQEGTHSKARTERTRAQTYTSLTDMASLRTTLNYLTIQYQTATQY